MRNLETKGAKRLLPEVAGSNPAPRTEFASVRTNGTNSSFATPQQLHRLIDNKNGLVQFYNRISGKQDFYARGNKPLSEFQRLAKIMCHNDYNDFITLYEDYLVNYKKLSKNVAYEYVRIAKKFVAPLPTVDFGNPKPIVDRISEFLDIENPNTYRNTLAALRHLLDMVSEKALLNDYKFKAVMPSFSIKTHSLDDVIKFGKAIEHEKISVYYYLGVVSAIRPEHLLRLRKKLFDKQNNMINTWMKTFGKKNFFFSFYTNEVKALIENYVDALSKEDSLLFPFHIRTIQKLFIDTSEKTGIKMVPKDMRKFATNWYRRHGMIPEDVDVITSHTPQTIVAKHYMDVSRIHEEYVEATKDLKLLS